MTDFIEKPTKSDKNAETERENIKFKKIVLIPTTVVRKSSLFYG